MVELDLNLGSLVQKLCALSSRRRHIGDEGNRIQGRDERSRILFIEEMLPEKKKKG